VSRVLTTCATELVLSLEHDNGATIEAVLGGHPAHKASWGQELRFGSVLFGQSRDIVVKVKGAKAGSVFLRATLKYQDVVTGEKVEKSAEAKDLAAAEAIEEHELRSEFVDALRGAITLGKDKKLKEAHALLQKVAAQLKASKVSKSERGADLLKDAEGQACEAVSKAEYFDKWGKHYLPSLMGAHLSQACNNFKDPGVQHYAGKLFESIRIKIDEIFLQLPPPKPSGHRASSSAAPVSMSSYYNSAGPCFAGSSLVMLASGQTTRVDEVKKGDIVATPSGAATVECVIETVAESGKFDLCELEGGLLVTPWHPIRHNGQWTFPAELSQSQSRDCPSIYSFLLESSHVMLINGYECVALAHGFEDSKVVAHHYFGTEQIRRDLATMRGWERGHVRLAAERCIERDPASGLVVRLVQLSESS